MIHLFRTKLVDSAAIMIRLQSLTLQRGPQRLLEDAELTLHAGHKAGLIGANGAGKSSLFALLRAELTPDAGDCLLPADWRIAHMRQEVDTLERLAVDYVLDGDERLREVQSSLAEAEAAQDGAAQARLHSSSTVPTATPPTRVRASCWRAWASPTSRWDVRLAASPAAGGCA